MVTGNLTAWEERGTLEGWSGIIGWRGDVLFETRRAGVVTVILDVGCHPYGTYTSY